MIWTAVVYVSIMGHVHGFLGTGNIVAVFRTYLGSTMYVNMCPMGAALVETLILLAFNSICIIFIVSYVCVDVVCTNII